MNNAKKMKEIIKFHEPSKKALEILEDKNLFERIIKEFDKKIEGEEKSKKAIFLSLCSAWVLNSEVPLNTMVSSESSAGKSFVCKNITKIFPRNMVVYRTKITPEAFTYWKKDDEDWTWDGKICYLEDISQTLLDAPTFKVMCSEGSTSTIVIKQKAVDINIHGKPVVLITTARTNPNTEILNRFQIIGLDESSQQTKNIVYRLARQNSSEEYDQDVIDALFHMKRLKVRIPYMENIANFLSEKHEFNTLRLRRDFSRLMDLIRCSAVLHQFQRKNVGEHEIEANPQDYEIAKEVINYIQTATFKGVTHRLKRAYEYCKKMKEFTAKEIHASYPFVNLRNWYGHLDSLLEKGMLKATLKKVEGVNQEVTYYKINEQTSFELPDYRTIVTFVSKKSKNRPSFPVENKIITQNKPTNVTIATKTTKPTIVTKVKEKKELTEEEVKEYYRKMGEDI